MHLTLLKPISSINFAFGFIKAQYINNHDPWTAGVVSSSHLLRWAAILKCILDKFSIVTIVSGNIKIHAERFE
jgi:hypothetical protein